MSFSPNTTCHVAATCAPAQAPRPSLSLLVTVWVERRALARMDETRLTDIGLNPVDAAREAARPFWDLPNHR